MGLKSLKVLGVMSGTSGDGLDLALCKFSNTGKRWYYKLIAAETIGYSRVMKENLIRSMELHSRDLIKLDHDYGKWIGSVCEDFLLRKDENADLIASHGHTVFHNPSESYTLQIGNGQDIAVCSNLPVIYDFRSMDVSLGGQGAPLVPVGDELLFGEYRACLNLGGFSNISYRQNTVRVAFDICPLNIALNYLAGKSDKDYDRDGETGRTGKVINELLKKLESLPYYSSLPPKSLGKEWFNEQFLPHLSINTELNDIMRTVYEHISNRISFITSAFKNARILVSGGGAHNIFLMELMRGKSSCKYILPDSSIIDYKEAIIFGFLGYLKYNGINNCYKSVTGAIRDSCSGILIMP
jgi:anhydro-N-acetylmuramic acid kinase